LSNGTRAASTIKAIRSLDYTPLPWDLPTWRPRAGGLTPDSDLEKRPISQMSELISILIPCYNAERWISHAIQSALAQSYDPIEIVVVDDGSRDRSLDIIRSFGSRVRWETGPNRGGNAARNRLLELARGKCLQYLDADDYLLPDKLALQVPYFAEDPDVDVLYGQVTKEMWTEHGTNTDLQLIPMPHDPWVLLARWYLPQTGGPLWRKSALEDVGGWKLDQPCCQEHELYLRLLMAGKRFKFCPHNGAVYRIWSNDTVCHRDNGEVRRQRLKVLAAEEMHLRANGELTAPRLAAISQARFEMARIAWREDRAVAREIFETLLASSPGFVPLGNQPGGHHPPLAYRVLWRLLGFRTAEVIAEQLSAIRSRTPTGSRVFGL
jgi:Glycosyl transferase family 2